MEGCAQLIHTWHQLVLCWSVERVWHLGAADAGRVALQPGEVAAGVDVQEVGPRRVADVHGHVVQAVRVDVAVEREHCGRRLRLRGRRPAPRRLVRAHRRRRRQGQRQHHKNKTGRRGPPRSHRQRKGRGQDRRSDSRA
uniref:Uncharacterized protein n=1 Tax=Arundo donax TaxID=35708 RepID=A0A0A9FI79_ARUDO